MASKARPRAAIAAAIAIAFGARLVVLPSTAGAADAAPKFAAASQDEAAARAAIETFEQGGSAVDAALAGSAMLGVTAPVSCGLGGRGFTTGCDAAPNEVFSPDS